MLKRIQHITRIASRLGQKKLFSLIGPLNKTIQPHQRYAIKKGYHHARSATSFNDTSNTDQWQKSVYELAAQYMHQENYHSVIDTGCGSAYKLVHLLGQYYTTGIEVEPTFSWLKQHYPQRNWLLFNTTNPANLTADLVICSDVIEHLQDPDKLLRFLSSIQFKKLLISTPERNAVAGTNDYGPPENTAHYREWNAAEFYQYVSGFFKIEKQLVLDDRSVTQVVICSTA